MPFNIEIIRMSPSNTNSILIDNGTDAAIFDPWGSASDWEKLLAERGLDLRAIYVTHGHYDHMSAIPKMNAKWFMNHADLPIIKWSNPFLFMYGYGAIDAKKNPPIDLAPGKIEILPGLSTEIIHTPGHSAGSVCFYFPEQKTVLTGDTLFYDTIGRTDLPGGSGQAMKESLDILRARNFPDDTTVIPGHGKMGKMSAVKNDNIFAQW
ncbi:MAG: MBL fold metallo-hydrolase [Alphaproteobacteria bacterium]|nr:MBL fold metallo-hydrolase [Alphaproteobacteria bacterium]